MQTLNEIKENNISSLKNSLDGLFNLNNMVTKPTILIVDDEENNLQLLVRTFRSSYSILTAKNGQEACEIVEKQGDNISLIITDQIMPVMTGVQFLKKITPKYPNIVKILLTGYSDSNDIIDAINYCSIYQYVLKPFTPSDLKFIVNQALAKYNLAKSNLVMVKDLKELFYNTLKSISSALDSKDPYTHGHSMRVTMYSLILARKLNLDDKMLEEIETAGLLHDIGKIGIPQSILCKPGKLTDEEFAIMKSHPEKGEKILTGIKKLAIISNWLKTHHERWDGRGYPLGLKGEEIPFSSRIIALADTYDAMTSTRSYRKALTHEVAIAEIEKCAGTQFDPNLAKIFVENQEEILQAKNNPEDYYKKYSYIYKNSNLQTESNTGTETSSATA